MRETIDVTPFHRVLPAARSVNDMVANRTIWAHNAGRRCHQIRHREHKAVSSPGLR
jgi:hypothetical protein